MKQQIKLFFFVKIVTFNVLTWICHFNSDISTFYNYSYKNSQVYRKLDTITYRLLSKHKKEKSSNILWMEEDMQNTGTYIKKDISSNKGTTGKSKHLCKSLLNNRGVYGKVEEGKPPSFNGGKTYFDKFIFNKINYIKAVKESANSDFMFLRKCIQRKINKVFALFIFFLIPIIVVAAILFIFYISNVSDIRFISGIGTLLGVICFIFFATFFRLYRKTVKYEKLIDVKREMHSTAYPSLGKVVIYNN
ncbi:Plasmodium exported protein, unknown function [Plasmodium malariae]|uniref:Uncharacterized protein n=1 Tax=Plasmodium malariae TaxID=5858 RepID=A0A1D3RJH3_PLAMA|nr:Plasmodium exported protein, unknown function [Plasmodium malariae]SCN45321.1 Plasmodium exported protein, unknown function [Plasmodium malariae]